MSRIGMGSGHYTSPDGETPFTLIPVLGRCAKMIVDRWFVTVSTTLLHSRLQARSWHSWRVLSTGCLFACSLLFACTSFAIRSGRRPRDRSRCLLLTAKYFP